MGSASLFLQLPADQIKVPDSILIFHVRLRYISHFDFMNFEIIYCFSNIKIKQLPLLKIVYYFFLSDLRFIAGSKTSYGFDPLGGSLYMG